MRKPVVGIIAAVTILFAGILAWNAEATTLTSATAVPPGTNFSLIEKAGCWLPGNCDIGQYQVCDRRGPLQV